MKHKTLFLIVVLVAILLVVPEHLSISAQSPNSTSSANENVMSDYAKDVSEGEHATANDIDAQNNQKGAKENENTEGNEEGENVETQEGINSNESHESQNKLESAKVENEGNHSESKDNGKNNQTSSNPDPDNESAD